MTLNPLQSRVAIQSLVGPVLTSAGFAAVWDNVDYEPVPGTSFCRVSIQWSAVQRTTMTGTAARGMTYEGAVDVDIFVPENSGPAAAEALWLALSNVLSEARLAVPEGCLEIGPFSNTGDFPAPPWYAINCRADFEIFDASL